MILMAVLSFQGDFGQLTWPFRGPISLHWWKSLFDQNADALSHANDIRVAGKNSLYLSLAAGSDRGLPLLHAVDGVPQAVAARFRRRRLLHRHARAHDAGLPPRCRHADLLGEDRRRTRPSGRRRSGANVIWGIPFGFLVMVAVWNRYDARVEEAARDLGADQRRTFREVTLPLIWTGIFGALPVRLHARRGTTTTVRCSSRTRRRTRCRSRSAG